MVEYDNCPAVGVVLKPVLSLTENEQRSLACSSSLKIFNTSSNSEMSFLNFHDIIILSSLGNF